jgi:hypothetical protein
MVAGSRFQEFINVYDKDFKTTMIWSFTCFLAWIIFPVLETKFKAISRCVNNDMAKAADFLAFFLIHIGSFRTYSFASTIWYSRQYELNEYNLLCQVVGLVFGFLCLYIYLSASTKLGLRGMYFGDCFGFIFDDKITVFPFNYLSHPQYYAIFGIALSYSLVMRSPLGFFIAGINALSFLIIAFLEAIQLKRLYRNKSR